MVSSEFSGKCTKLGLMGVGVENKRENHNTSSEHECLISLKSFFRWISMYYLLPETEDRTLEDIEVHFSNNQRKLTDRKIQKNMSVQSFVVPANLVVTTESERKLKEELEAKEANNKKMNQLKEKKSPNTMEQGLGTKPSNLAKSGHTNKAFISDN